MRNKISKIPEIGTTPETIRVVIDIMIIMILIMILIVSLIMGLGDETPVKAIGEGCPTEIFLEIKVEDPMTPGVCNLGNKIMEFFEVSEMEILEISEMEIMGILEVITEIL